MQKSSLFGLIILSAVVNYFLVFLIHGYAHNLISYVYGLNEAPWELNFSNLWLQNVTENLEFSHLDQQANFFVIGIIGFFAYAVNWIMLFWAKTMLAATKHKVVWISFWFWFFIWNLTAVFSYIPHHLLEISNVNVTFHKLGVSIWMVYLIGGVGALFMLSVMCFSMLSDIFSRLGITDLFWCRMHFGIILILVMFFNNIHYSFISGIFAVISNGFFLLKLSIVAIICYSVKLKPTQGQH